MWCTHYRRWQHRGKDLASTHVLCPHQGTGLSSILEKTSRGDTRELYCQRGGMTGRNKGLGVKMKETE